MKTRILIACAGHGRRWNNYLGVPKQLVRIEKQPLLHRTIQQIRTIDAQAEIIIVAAKSRKFMLPGTQLWVPTTNTDAAPAVHTCQSLWNADGMTVMLFGDVAYTQNALETILAESAHMPMGFTFFGRLNASAITGKPYGELFGLKFLPATHDRFMAALTTLQQLALPKPLHWHFYRVLHALEVDTHVVYLESYTEIDDATEDFDFPHDYDTYIKRVYSR